jgi:radical SAM protein with 4Fe4S-binding SPASM domain
MARSADRDRADASIEAGMRMSLGQRLMRVLNPVRRGGTSTVAPGIYHYMREADGTYTRFHLRVEPDGSGMLVANATAAARLSITGVMMAKALLEGEDEDAVLARIINGFRDASGDKVRGDIERVKALIEELASPGDNYPILNLEDPAISPRVTQLMAPLRADIPLAEPGRVIPLIDRLWTIGIPHVTVMTSQFPDPAHLVRIIERAEDTGMIAGVRVRGTDLMQGTLLNDLALAGVDHVSVLYASAEPDVHNALCGEGDHVLAERAFQRVYELEVCPVAEVPLIEATADRLPETMDALHGLGHVRNVSFFAIASHDERPSQERNSALPADALPQVAALVEELAHRAKVRTIWMPPVLKRPDRTLAAQVLKGPRSSGDIAVRIEPDGSVIPPRGPYRSAGNILTDPWDAIWRNEAFRAYRERVESSTRCDVCPGLAICAADCPRNSEGWAT